MKKNTSIFVKLGLASVLSVVLVMTILAFFNYQVAKNSFAEALDRRADASLKVLSSNLANFIDAYQINEYEKIIQAELENQDRYTRAILVKDYRMGAIIGDKAFISGKIREADGNLVYFNIENSVHQQLLEETYFTKAMKIRLGDEEIGEVILYVTDEELRQMLRSTLMMDLLIAVAISVLLIILLFLFNLVYLVRPLDRIMQVFRDHDAEGIPLQRFAEDGPREIQVLSSLMNRVTDQIRASRHLLRAKNRELDLERERFQLAIDGTLDGLWDWNLQTGSIYLSERFSRMLGYAPGDLPNDASCWKMLMHLDDRNQARNVLRRYLSSGGAGTYENTFRMRTRSGEWRWITARGKAHFDENGKALRFVGFNTDVTRLMLQQEELEKKQETLQYQASHDPLTGLANRSMFMDRLSHSLEKAKRENSKVAVLFVDLDHFKSINDSLGHHMGDKVLRLITERLSHSVRSADTLARLGGDEFTVVIEGLSRSQDASVLAEKIIERLQEKISIEGHDMFLGCSIGISIFPDNGMTPSELLKNADVAMYRAKNSGRNNFQYYSVDMTEQAFDRLSMETSLRRALKDKEFIVYYQPQIDARNGQVIGAEALVRWNTPDQGMIPPGRFIPVAESSNLIIELDRFVMQTAIMEFGNWFRSGLYPGVLSMNLSIKQLQQQDFLAQVIEYAREADIDPDFLELEVTEGQLMEDPEESIDTLQNLSDIGIRLALDDFGTGYSSLSYLKRLPISKLKIDQSFVRGLPDDLEDAAISKALIALAETLSLDILAEGTERLEQVRFLSELGCHKFQGYYYARPMPAEDFQQFLLQRQQPAYRTGS